LRGAIWEHIWERNAARRDAIGHYAMKPSERSIASEPYETSGSWPIT